MTIQLNLSDHAHPKYTRVSEVGVMLKVLLAAYSEFDNEIAKETDIDRIVSLRLEQEKTGEVFQRLMELMDAAKGGRGE